MSHTSYLALHNYWTNPLLVNRQSRLIMPSMSPGCTSMSPGCTSMSPGCTSMSPGCTSMCPLDVLLCPLDVLLCPLDVLLCPLDVLLCPLDVLLCPLDVLLCPLDVLTDVMPVSCGQVKVCVPVRVCGCVPWVTWVYFYVPWMWVSPGCTSMSLDVLLSPGCTSMSPGCTSMSLWVLLCPLDVLLCPLDVLLCPLDVLLYPLDVLTSICSLCGSDLMSCCHVKGSGGACARVPVCGSPVASALAVAISINQSHTSENILRSVQAPLQTS